MMDSVRDTPVYPGEFWSSMPTIEDTDMDDDIEWKGPLPNAMKDD